MRGRKGTGKREAKRGGGTETWQFGTRRREERQVCGQGKGGERKRRREEGHTEIGIEVGDKTNVSGRAGTGAKRGRN